MVCKLPLAIFICGMLGTAHAIQMVREERPMLREERPQTRPAKKTFFSDRHTPHSALTAHPLAASLAHVVEQSSNSSTPGTAAKVGSMAQALVALAAKGPMADAFAPVIASIRTSLRTDINNTVSGVGTQLQAKMDAISACATNHGYNSAGIATRIAYDSAKSAYDTAKAAVQTATTAAETECGTKDTKCTTRDNRGNALHNTITTGGDCGAAAPNMFDLENFPLKDASTWADQIKTAVTAWETAATTCATAETTCATKQTDISNALTEKGTKCTALATAATNGKQAYDTCYDTAKGQLTGYDYQAQVTTQKDAIEQIEKLICIVKVAVKSHEEGGTASTDGAIACGDVPVSSGGTTTQAQYRCTCTSSSLTPSEQYQETYDIGVTVPSEPEKDTAWDDKGCADGGAVYADVGQGRCTDSNGEKVNQYAKFSVSGYTDASCRKQCDSDSSCVAYNVLVPPAAALSACHIFVPNRGSAPDGWTFRNGDGGPIQQGDGSLGTVCMKKQG